MVSGDGWISNDSSFYGTEEQQHQKQRCEKYDLKSLWCAHSNDINVMMMGARA